MNFFSLTYCFQCIALHWNVSTRFSGQSVYFTLIIETLYIIPPYSEARERLIKLITVKYCRDFRIRPLVYLCSKWVINVADIWLFVTENLHSSSRWHHSFTSVKRWVFPGEYCLSVLTVCLIFLIYLLC